MTDQPRICTSSALTLLARLNALAAKVEKSTPQPKKPVDD
jgi:hypothetical protein